jgi:hypothetical protein
MKAAPEHTTEVRSSWWANRIPRCLPIPAGKRGASLESGAAGFWARFSRVAPRK